MDLKIKFLGEGSYGKVYLYEELGEKKVIKKIRFSSI